MEVHHRTNRPVTRVAVVDDDDVTRRGLVELLAEHPQIEVTGALSHERALDWGEEWHGIDVVIVDACDERQPHDHFPGVAVVERIRRYRPTGQTLIIVRTGHYFDDAVRRRMGEARADYFFHRSELQDADDLRSVVLQPGRFRPGVPELADPAAAQRYGVSRVTKVNEAVARATEGALGTVGGIGRSRGRARQREQFNRTARLTPVNSDGGLPDRNQRDPSMPQIARFLEWATRSKHPGG